MELLLTFVLLLLIATFFLFAPGLIAYKIFRSIGDRSKVRRYEKMLSIRSRYGNHL